MKIQSGRLSFILLLWLTFSPMPLEGCEWPVKVPTLIGRWRAGLIGYVEVIKVKEVDGEQVSSLKFLSVIKSDGRPEPTVIKAHIKLGSHWPYEFSENSQAIAYLEFDEEEKRYVDFDYFGGIDVDDRTGKLFVDQYSKLSKILKESDESQLLKKKVDWYFDFVSNPPTRRHATHGIRSLWRNAAKKKLLNKDQLEGASQLLSAKQKEQICKLLADEETTTDSFSLIELLHDHQSAEIDNYLLRALKRSLKIDDEVPYDEDRVSDLAIELLPRRLKFQLPQHLKDKLLDYQNQRQDYYFDISIGDEYSETDKEKARETLIESWRSLAKEFLEVKARNEI